MWGQFRELLVIAIVCTAGVGVGTGAPVGHAVGLEQPVATASQPPPSATPGHHSEPGTHTGTPENESPLADAGLDQTVPLGATVYLDGGGSVDPDGELVAFDWVIERPDGVRTTGTCRTTDCVQASFSPASTGVYAVTLTVTDDDGATATDTLYVTVTEEAPPSVTLSGPDSLQVNETGRFRLRGERGDNFLSAVTWRVDGDRTARLFVDDSRLWEQTHAFKEPGTYTVSGTLTDVIGLSATAEQTVRVEPDVDHRFVVEIADTNSPVPAGDTATVTASIENVGEETATQQVDYYGPPADTARTVRLAGGESTTETFRWETRPGDAGEHPVELYTRNDSANTMLDVINGSHPYFDVSITDATTPREVGEPVTVTVNITNKGTAADVQTTEVAYHSGSESKDIRLSPGSSTTEQFTFATSPVTHPTGRSPVTVASANATDTTQIDLYNAEKTLEVLAVSSGDPAYRGFPEQSVDGVDDSYGFDVTVKNTGNRTLEDGDSTVTLRLSDKDLVIGTYEIQSTINVGEEKTIDGSEFDLNVPEAADGHWAASGTDGWHQYEGETDTAVATTDTWDGTEGRVWTMPPLPEFEITSFGLNNDGGGTTPVDDVWSSATVKNTGYFPGKFDGRLVWETTAWDDGTNPHPGYDTDCGEACTFETPQTVDESTDITLSPDEDTEVPLDYETNGYNEKYENAAFTFETENHHTGGVNSETGSVGWRIDTPADGGPEPGGDCDPDGPGPRLDIEVADVFPDVTESTPYDVKLYKCNEDGTLIEQDLSPSEYTVSWHTNSEGRPENVDIGKEEVTGYDDPRVDGCGIRYAWEVSHKHSDAHMATGATWERITGACEPSEG